MFVVDIYSKIYSWGDNYSGQSCNNYNLKNDIYSPTIANMLEEYNVKKIICLDSCTIILVDNKLYSIGYGRYGELGLDIIKTKEITLIIEGVEKVWGNKHTVFCKMCNGDLYAWGENNRGQLGINNTINQYTPVRLNIQQDIKSINYFDGVTYAITTSREIYTWGNNKLVSKEYILKPTLFTYFLDNGIEIKTINHTKSARKNDYYNIL